MNAAFLLVTSAWLAGQAPPPPPTRPAPPPGYAAPAPGYVAPGPGCATPAPVPSSACCNTGCDSCDSCCESGGFFGRLRGLFHRHNDCDACDSCGGHHQAAPPCPAPPAPKDCCATSSCNDCGCGGRGLFSRLRGLFHRHDGCDDCATDCCGSAAVAPHAPALPPPEPIRAPKSSEPPKAMPKGSTSGAGLILPQPALAPATTFIIGR